MRTLFANLYVLLTLGPHMVYMGTPYIFDIYMIRCGWLERAVALVSVSAVTVGNVPWHLLVLVLFAVNLAAVA